MKWIALALSTGLTAALTITAAYGQGTVIYPAKGQTPEQQNKDKGECHVWAVQQSGFDPTQAQAPTAPPPSQGGERARGAARGAAAGAAVGAVAGDAGKGAAAGAAAGTAAGSPDPAGAGGIRAESGWIPEGSGGVPRGPGLHHQVEVSPGQWRHRRTGHP